MHVMEKFLLREKFLCGLLMDPAQVDEARKGLRKLSDQGLIEAKMKNSTVAKAGGGDSQGNWTELARMARVTATFLGPRIINGTLRGLPDRRWTRRGRRGQGDLCVPEWTSAAKVLKVQGPEMHGALPQVQFHPAEVDCEWPSKARSELGSGTQWVERGCSDEALFSCTRQYNQSHSQRRYAVPVIAC